MEVKIPPMEPETPVLAFRIDPDGETTMIFSDGRTISYSIGESLLLMRMIRVAAKDYIMRGGGGGIPAIKKIGVEKVLKFLDSPIPEEEQLEFLFEGREDRGV